MRFASELEGHIRTKEEAIELVKHLLAEWGSVGEPE